MQRSQVHIDHLARASGAALVQNTKHAYGSFGDKVYHVLVVLITDKVPLHFLSHVHLLLQLEHMLNEQIMQRLICEIDAELQRHYSGKTALMENGERREVHGQRLGLVRLPRGGRCGNALLMYVVRSSVRCDQGRRLRERVDCEIFEAKDVEHARAVSRVVRGDVVIDHIHTPVEAETVHVHAERVPRHDGNSRLKRHL